MRLENNSLAPTTDQELAERIAISLRSHHVPSLRKLKVVADGGSVVLRGEVSSFYAKQLSQHSARRLAGERHVVDEVSVVTPAAFRDPFRLPKSAIAGAALLFVALVAGCSKGAPPRLPVHPVSGEVHLNGKPAAGAVVEFHPKAGDKNSPRPRAQADQQGRFVLSTYDLQDGAPAGDYAVTVEQRKVTKKGDDFEFGPNLVPPKYSSPATTGVVVSVAEGTNTIPIKITR